MEFSKWIKYAENNNLILNVNQYKKLVVGQQYDMVEIDYIKFLYFEYPERYNLEANKVYNPTQLYNSIKRKKVSTGKITTEKSFVWKKCCKVVEDDVNYYGFEDFNLYESDKGRLASGSGDGFSRWILWENLENMPDVYFKQ